MLEILKITKQSLSRVLSQLVREDIVIQRTGSKDRRQRLLELTEKGFLLEKKLSENQRERIGRAYKNAGAEAVEGYRKVILGMINEKDRQKFLKRSK